MRQSIRCSAVLIAGAIAAPVAMGHHGFGTFVMDEDIEITGTVTGLDFVNPHAWLYLDVASEGQTVPFRCEMRSATTLRRSGWTPDMFPVGREITIIGSPDENDDRACYVSTVEFEDGSTIDRYGQRTPPTRSATDQREPRLASGVPNLNGDWGAEQLVMSDPRGVGGSLMPLSQAETVADETRSSGPGRGGNVPLIVGDAASRLFIGGVELTPEGEAAMAGFRRETNPAMRCEPIGILMDWTYDSPVNRITQSDDRIVLEYGKFDYSRTILLDQTDHPSDPEPSLTGHSIGRWDGDTLVVDTVGVRAGSLTRGLVHSDSLQLTERFTLDFDTMALTREFEARDPLYYVTAYTGSDVVHPSNVPYEPSPCDDRSLF